MIEHNGTGGSGGDRRARADTSPLRAWWEQRGYVVVRSLVVLLIAGLATAAYSSWRAPARPPAARLPGVVAAQSPSAAPRLRITTVDPFADVVHIISLDQEPVDLTGWRIVAAHRDRPTAFYFPPSVSIASGDAMRVFTRRGIDDGADFFWNMADDADVWDWRAGTAILYEPSGREVSRFSYAHGAPAPPEPSVTPGPGGTR
jgi:hypothetical protein